MKASFQNITFQCSDTENRTLLEIVNLEKIQFLESALFGRKNWSFTGCVWNEIASTSEFSWLIGIHIWKDETSKKLLQKKWKFSHFFTKSYWVEKIGYFWWKLRYVSSIFFWNLVSVLPYVCLQKVTLTYKRLCTNTEPTLKAFGNLFG